MTWTIERPFVRDDGVTEINVTFDIESVGYPSNGWDDAGEGPELSIVSAAIIAQRPTGHVERFKWEQGRPPYDDATLAVELTQAERDRIEQELCEDPDLGSFLDDDHDELSRDDYRDRVGFD